jgi:hypothetical protein
MSFDAIGHEGGLAAALVEAIKDIGKKFKINLHKKLPVTIFNDKSRLLTIHDGNYF